MSLRKERLQDFRLYAVTAVTRGEEDLLAKAEQAFEGGVDILQLRSKELNDSELYRLGLKLAELSRAKEKLFIVNDRVDLALAVGADGVHLGQDDLPMDVARKMADAQGQSDFIVGRSTHSLEQAQKAEADATDYIGVGPVYETPSKPGRKSVGLELVEAVTPIIKIPYVAIGGIDHSNVSEVLESGATRVAVIRAIFSAKDVEKAASDLKQKIVGGVGV